MGLGELSSLPHISIFNANNWTLAAGLVTAVLSSTTITMFAEFYRLRTPVIVWLASNVAGDIIITGVLVFYLVHHLHSTFLPNFILMPFLGEVQDWDCRNG
jgi:hypothetical protein